jgi:C4-dicarboxylate-specific signal transduction histidine kinase
MASFVPFRNGQESDRPSFDVSDVLQEVAERLEIYGMRRGVQVEVDAPPYAMVSAEPARMRQVFSQLLTLAIDATSPGGDVIVTAFHEEEGIEVEFAEGGAEMIDAPGVSANSPVETAASEKRLADARRLLAAEGVELEIRQCADGAKAYILQLGRPGTQDAESLRAA